MEKEFNLSEKAIKNCGGVCPSDIKEFIRLEDDLITRVICNEISFKELWILRDKLLGEKFR